MTVYATVIKIKQQNKLDFWNVRKSMNYDYETKFF